MDIVIFCCNRPDKLRMCLESINIDYADTLWIFCDGAKSKDHYERVKDTFEVASKFSYSNKQVQLRPKNYGTPRNVIDGLDEVFEKTEFCFILEDDCIVAPQAFEYVDWALKAFKNDTKVFSVNTMSPYSGAINKIFSVFSRGDIVALNRVFAFWGWGTWADRWKEFRSDLEPFKNPYGSALNVPKSLGLHVLKTLKLYEQGKVGGWDARLLVLTKYAERFHLHPMNSLMRNIGLDGSGVHFSKLQLNINHKNDLQFSNYMPTLKKGNILLSDNKLIKLFDGFNYILKHSCSKILSIIPLKKRLQIKKYFTGMKRQTSQY